jgi:hemoglobin/transferrin/lactoferrin receptor protein
MKVLKVMKVLNISLNIIVNIVRLQRNLSWGWILLILFLGVGQSQTFGRLGRVLNELGQPVVGAKLTVRSSSGGEIERYETGPDGRFRLGNLPPGTYQMTVERVGFQLRQISLSTLPETSAEPLEIRLTLDPLQAEVTVTAERGAVLEIERSPSLVVAREGDRLTSLPLPTIGHALEATPGVLLQQTTYGQVSPFLRGLTGYQVLNLVDGLRFNNSTFRSGPNQYLAYLEPSQVQRLEAMLGPSSAQYGSDAMGGAIHLLTDSPSFGSGKAPAWRGEMGLFGASADLSAGANAKLTVGTDRYAWLGGLQGRRHQDLRPGQGIDSRHAFRRLFGLSPELIRELTGNRLQDSGFQAMGAHTKMVARLAGDQYLTFRYQHSRLEGVRAYKDLWGGLGRLQSRFEPQSLHFLYGRYEKLGLGWLDSLTATVSLNSQRDGSLRQGQRATDRIVEDENRVDAFGYVTQATTHLGSRQVLVFGGEIYHERVTARRDETDPLRGETLQRRALYPNGSRYTTSGLFAHHTWDLVRRADSSALRATVGLRYTGIGFRTFANQNRGADGANLGVVDASSRFDDLTYQASLSWQVFPNWGFHVQTGRGFRAPNLNDLGALGLNDLGYEVPAASAVGLGGLIGTSDGEGVGTNSRPVAALRPERLYSYEAGSSWRFSRFTARVQLFQATLEDPIVRRTLLFPVTAVPASLAGLVVTPIAQTAAQRAQQVVTVATIFDPRAVKAFLNEGRAFYSGVESNLRLVLTRQLSLEGGYSFLTGRELNPNRFIRRLPPQQGHLALRFQPTGSWWMEASGQFSGQQSRLSGGDLTDERIGAARRRRDVTDFFQGALVRPFLVAGPDGRLGTADDLFAPTGETVAAIRDRLLPLGSVRQGVLIADDNTRVPLWTETKGFAVFHLTTGYRFGERWALTLALRNLFDRNYRLHGSGIDEAGRQAYLGLRFSF